MIRKISFVVSILIHAAGLTTFIIFHFSAPKPEQQHFVLEKYEEPMEENYETPPIEESVSLPEEYIIYAENNTQNPVEEQDTSYIDEQIIKSITPNISYIPKVNTQIKTKSGLLKGFGNGKGNREGMSSGTILGDSISAKKLGIILDISPSMQPHIEVLESEIRKGFKNYVIERVDGCELLTTGSPTMTALRSLVSKEVDTIYWFCDLQDRQTPKALVAMSKYLEKKNIKFYIKSLDQKPNFYLVKIVNRSGGQIL